MDENGTGSPRDAVAGRFKGKRFTLWTAFALIVLIAGCVFYFWDAIWNRYLAYRFDAIAVLVVYDSDPGREGMTGVGDRLTCFGHDGEIQWERRGLSPGGELSGREGLVLDPERYRIYVQDIAGERILVLDPRGTLLFTIGHPYAHDMAVNGRTGDLWCLSSASEFLEDQPKTTAYEATGSRLMISELQGNDIEYNRFDNTLWIVGDGILKLDANGQRLADGPSRPGWFWFSAAPDHRDGSIWVFGRNESNDYDTVLLRLQKDGTLLRELRFANRWPTSVAVEPATGDPWITFPDESSVDGVPMEGTSLSPLRFAAWGATFSERRGTLWLTLYDDDKVIGVRTSGDLVGRHDFPGIHSIVWTAAP